MKKVQAMMVMACLLVAALTGTAAAAHMFHTYDNECTIKVSGFEHWGKAAASTRDTEAECFNIQAKVHYKNSSQEPGQLTGNITTLDYYRVTAGFGTDWTTAKGRSPQVDAGWQILNR